MLCLLFWICFCILLGMAPDPYFNGSFTSHDSLRYRNVIFNARNRRCIEILCVECWVCRTGSLRYQGCAYLWVRNIGVKKLFQVLEQFCQSSRQNQFWNRFRSMCAFSFYICVLRILILLGRIFESERS